MGKTKNKTITAITLVLILTLSAIPLIILPTVQAVDVATRAFLAVNPNPIGVNQRLSVTMWIEPLLPTVYDEAHDLMVTITRPDTIVDTMGPYTTDAAGIAFFTYEPTQTGTYTIQLIYPGETFASTGDYYEPSTSPETELVVQQDPIEPYPGAALPTEYWEHPINPENREWDVISGDWLMRTYNSTYMSFDSVAAFNPYSQAPMAPHIMWTKEYDLGGLIGGEYDSTSYYSGRSYEPMLTPPIIMNGRLYYRTHSSLFGTPWLYPGVVCVDLRTGEELWRNDEANIDLGQIFNYWSGNQRGGFPFLWDTTGTSYKMYDAFTGELILSFDNSMQGTVEYGQNGELYVYVLDSFNGWLAKWDSTKAFKNNFIIANFITTVGDMLLPMPGTYDWMAGIEWNVTIPIIPLSSGSSQVSGSAHVVDDVLLQFYGPSFAIMPYHVGYSTETGEQLWAFNRTRTPFPHFLAIGEGMYAQWDGYNGQWIAYDADTGIEKWVSDETVYPWGIYLGGSDSGLIAYGKLYSIHYDGYLHAFDLENGDEVWKFSSENSGLETPYNNYPFWYGPMIADGVVFAGTGDMMPPQPLARGDELYAVDAEKGEQIWVLGGNLVTTAIAYGYLLCESGYDNRIYCIGKGPSAITANAAPKVVPLGSLVQVEGSVTDISAGTTQNEQTARFPNGVPAIADEHMGDWMGYVYMQKPRPTDAIGVPVRIQIIDPDGKFAWIGTATSDSHGNYAYSFTPQIEGQYTIIATFVGSNSYWGSETTTYLTVGSALTPGIEPETEPPTTPPTEPPTEPPTTEEPTTEPPTTEEPTTEPPTAEAPFPTTEVIIVAAVAVAVVIGVGAYWALRRRK